MKKTICLLLIITFAALFMSSCEKYERTGENSYVSTNFFSQSVQGIENIDRSADCFDLCVKLLPSDFLEKYSYIDGDYYFYSRLALIYKPQKDVTKALLYLVYDDETYLEAKKDVLSWDLDFENTHKMGGYVFHQNLKMFNSRIETGFYESSAKPSEVLPRDYTMIAYNDDKKTIVFFGKIDENEMTNSFEDHIREYYGEWYEFS